MNIWEELDKIKKSDCSITIYWNAAISIHKSDVLDNSINIVVHHKNNLDFQKTIYEAILKYKKLNHKL